MQDNLSELYYLEEMYCSEEDNSENLNWHLNRQEDEYRDQEFNA
ncbi:hypothetical protein [Macrococcoides canis]|nr:hypothetical protein [Macrococcus canis]